MLYDLGGPRRPLLRRGAMKGFLVVAVWSLFSSCASYESLLAPEPEVDKAQSIFCLVTYHTAPSSGDAVLSFEGVLNPNLLYTILHAAYCPSHFIARHQPFPPPPYHPFLLETQAHPTAQCQHTSLYTQSSHFSSRACLFPASPPTSSPCKSCALPIPSSPPVPTLIPTSFPFLA